MEISAAVVKSLRDKTGAGMMDCKKALQESDGDIEKAIEYLRKKGAATAEKRADRSANEGVIATSTAGGATSMIEVNCETDFVAKSDDFLAFANAALAAVSAGKPADVDALLTASAGASTVGTMLTDLIGKIGEKIEVKRFATFESDGYVAEYIHPGAKLGVLIELSVPASDAVTQLARDLAMQIAAMNPVAIDRDSVPVETRQKELDIYRQQAAEQGKPENMLDRIAEGKLNKFFQEYTLVEQSFIRDNTKTVKEHIDTVAAEVGSPIVVRRFVRFQVGDAA
jgi:elongation factor Ts